MPLEFVESLEAAMKQTIALGLFFGLFAVVLLMQPSAEPRRKTEVSIHGDAFQINGKPTYAGRSWKGQRVEGLLFNARMVQGIFDDLNPQTRKQWAYPDTGRWDPERNTREFLAAMPEWRRHELLAFAVNLQGANPREAPDPTWHNSALTRTGELRSDYMARLQRILDLADDLGMVVLLGVFNFWQDERLDDEAAVKHGLDAAVDWVLDRGYRNVLLEVNNECDGRYHHDLLKPGRIHELIERAKGRQRDGRRLLVGTSCGTGMIPGEQLVGAADFLILHGDPMKISEMVNQTRKIPGYRPMPILFIGKGRNGSNNSIESMQAAVGAYCSWSYFDLESYQYPPINWGINTERQRVFFKDVEAITNGIIEFEP
jgi:hypothetical protein